jgi:hypothetical protein
MSGIALKELGLRSWEAREGLTLFLFPGEWYSYIPEGFEVVTLRYNREVFARGVSDDDTRFGYLAYGILAVAS